MVEKIRVLYVDDESDLLNIGKLFLERTGDFSVATIVSASAALELIKKEQFDVIISDYQMPGMDGIQFLIEVRTKFGLIPFILFTGRGREEVVIQAINSGADFYLQKGGDPSAQFAELTHKIKSAASSKRAADSLQESEEKYQVIVDHALEAIMIIDSSANVIFANPAAATLVDIGDSSACIGKNALEFIAPESREAALADLESSWEGMDGYLAQYKIITATARERWVELIGKKISFGGVPAVIVMFWDVTERKRADLLIRESEEKFRTLLQNINDGVVVHELHADGAGKIIEVNDRFCEITGYTRDELLQLSVADLDTPELRAQIPETMRQLADKKYAIFENEYRTPDGRRVPIEVSVRIFDLQGKPVGLSTVRNITERKRAEEALRESEERHRILLNDFPDPIFSFYPDGTYRHVNRAFATGVGKSADQITGKKIWDVFPKDEADKRFSALSSVFSTGVGKEIEVHVPDPDGDRIYVTTIIPVKDESGSVVSAICSSKDITDRKRAEDALRESEEKYRGIFENALIGIFETAPDGRIINANEAAARIFGYADPAEICSAGLNVGRDLYANPDDRKKAIDHLQKTGYVEIDELRVQNRDKSTFWASAAVRAVRDPDGIISCFEGSIVDISKRKQAEETLRESEEKFRLLTLGSSDAIGILGPTGKIQYISKNIVDITGFQPWEYEGTTALEFVHPDDCKEIEALFEQIIGGTAKSLMKEFRISRKDGGWAWVEVLGTNYLDNPAVNGIVLNFRNITERKQMEDAHLTNENRLQMAQEIGHIGCWEYDIKTHQMWGSEEGCHLFGYPRMAGSFPIEDFTSCIVERELVLKAFDDLINEGKDYDLEFIINPKDGSAPRMLHNIGKLEKDEQGNPVKVKGIIQDVTGRKRAEDTLRESQEGYLLLAEHMTDIVFLMDMDIKTTYQSPSSEKLRGYTSKEITDLPLEKNLTPESLKLALEVFFVEIPRIKADPGYNPVIKLELEYYRKDGTTFWSESKFSIIRDGSGKPVSILGEGRDITERKVAEEALQKSEERYRAIYDQSPIAIELYDATGALVHVNPACLSLFGIISISSIQNFSLFADPNINDEQKKRLHQGETVQYQGPFDFEKVKAQKLYPTSREGIIWLDVLITPLGNRADSITGFLVQIQDITDRKQAEKALRESEERLSSIYTTIGDIVFLLDIDQNGEFTFNTVNPAFLRTTGISAESVVGWNIKDVIPEPSLALVLNKYRQAIQEKQLSAGKRLPNTQPEISQPWLLSHLSLILMERANSWLVMYMTSPSASGRRKRCGRASYSTGASWRTCRITS